MLRATAVALPAYGVTWTVAPDGSEDHNSIQEAVLAAASGDSVLVLPGTYVELVSLPSGITLISRDGPEVTITDGDQRGSIIRCAGNDTRPPTCRDYLEVSSDPTRATIPHNALAN